jgi:hypothetical protein
MLHSDLQCALVLRNLKSWHHMGWRRVKPREERHARFGATTETAAPESAEVAQSRASSTSDTAVCIPDTARGGARIAYTKVGSRRISAGHAHVSAPINFASHFWGFTRFALHATQPDLDFWLLASLIVLDATLSLPRGTSLARELLLAIVSSILVDKEENARLDEGKFSRSKLRRVM